MKNAYRKVRKFMTDHEEGIFTGTMIAALVATTAATVYLVNEEAKEQKKVADWTREQNFSGKAVYQLADGSYLAVSQDQVS